MNFESRVTFYFQREIVDSGFAGLSISNTRLFYERSVSLGAILIHHKMHILNLFYRAKVIGEKNNFSYWEEFSLRTTIV